MVLKLWHCWMIWYLFARFKTVILCSGHFVWFVKYVFFLLKYDSWKLQLESWNTNHESLNRTLTKVKIMKQLHCQFKLKKVTEISYIDKECTFYLMKSALDKFKMLVILKNFRHFSRFLSVLSFFSRMWNFESAFFL